MRFILCKKQFLNPNANAEDNANAEMSMTSFQIANDFPELLHKYFFQHDSKLNETMKIFTPMTFKNSLQ